MSSTKTISVLIPTLGRDKEVRDTIQALLNQTRVPDEIVVVDQNADDFPELDKYLDSLPLVKHVKSDTLGLGFNANVCLAHATSDIVLYLDDDITPDPRLVEMHLENYEKLEKDDPHFGGVAGRVEQPSGDPDPKTIKRVGVFHRLSGTITARFNAIERHEVDIAPGGNMSFYRHILNKIDGCDLGFAGNSYFIDTDCALRVKQAGYRIVFDPRATLKHLMAPAGGCRTRTKSDHTFYFVKNGVRVFRRHTPAWARSYCYLRLTLYIFAKALYNRDFGILKKSLQALFEGMTQSMDVQGVRSLPERAKP
ncbi:MAG: glycosyltransferase family 2 protein [Bdellovibrionia bacterium]